MFAKIRHLAIRTQKVTTLKDVYMGLFGMQESDDHRSPNAPNISDGYLGLNILPRGAGRQAGLDHFGIEVEDIELVEARLMERYPSVKMLRRPSNRPFAGISTHDPTGQIFDLSWAGMDHKKGVYTDEIREQDRRIKHFALHTVDPITVATFYREVFELQELEADADDPNFYLSDGRVTLVVCPWRITDFEGGAIERPALDHIGFEVESLDAVQKELQELVESNPELTPVPWGEQGDTTLREFAKCKYGQYRLSDPDGVLVDVAEA